MIQVVVYSHKIKTEQTLEFKSERLARKFLKQCEAIKSNPSKYPVTDLTGKPWMHFYFTNNEAEYLLRKALS